MKYNKAYWNAFNDLCNFITFQYFLVEHFHIMTNIYIYIYCKDNYNKIVFARVCVCVCMCVCCCAWESGFVCMCVCGYLSLCVGMLVRLCAVVYQCVSFPYIRKKVKYIRNNQNVQRTHLVFYTKYKHISSIQQYII